MCGMNHSVYVACWTGYERMLYALLYSEGLVAEQDHIWHTHGAVKNAYSDSATCILIQYMIMHLPKVHSST